MYIYIYIYIYTFIYIYIYIYIYIQFLIILTLIVRIYNNRMIVLPLTHSDLSFLNIKTPSSYFVFIIWPKCLNFMLRGLVTLTYKRKIHIKIMIERFGHYWIEHNMYYKIYLQGLTLFVPMLRIVALTK